MLANIGFLIFGVVVSLLALIGLLSAVRGTPVQRVSGLENARRPCIADRAFQEGIELVSRTPLTAGHTVEILTNGDSTYPRLWEDLRSARDTITMQMYVCQPGRLADKLRDILLERARAGVRVLFLYDAFGSSLPKEYIEGLEGAGVKTAKFRPLSLLTAYKVQHRAHIREVCVDGRIGYTGGFGIDDKWSGNGRTKGQWRDSNVRFEGPAVRQLQAAFVACWAEATGDLLVDDALFCETSEHGSGGSVAGLLHGSPSVGSTEAERFFALSIAGAQKTLFITNSYFVPDDDFRRMIADAARRGVDTRILTAGDECDVKTTLYAGRSQYEELLEAGVRIFEYRETMMHAKTLVADGLWSAVGSMNADNRSMSFNEETVLLMLDKQLAGTLEQHFHDDMAHSNEIALETFGQRGIWERTKEHATHLVWRVL